MLKNIVISSALSFSTEERALNKAIITSKYFCYLKSIESGGLKGMDSNDGNLRSTAQRVTSGIGVPACNIQIPTSVIIT